MSKKLFLKIYIFYLSHTLSLLSLSLFRYHGTSIVNFDSERGGISLEQEKTESGTTSKLLLTKANFRDSGNYSCVPMGALSASVIVHVINGNWGRLFNVGSALLTCYYNLLLFLQHFFIFLQFLHTLNWWQWRRNATSYANKRCCSSTTSNYFHFTTRVKHFLQLT